MIEKIKKIYFRDSKTWEKEEVFSWEARQLKWRKGVVDRECKRKTLLVVTESLL